MLLPGIASRLSKNNSRPILLIENNFGTENQETDSVSVLLRDACSQRRIPMILSIHPEEDIRKLNPWAVINAGTPNKKIRSLCFRKGMQYVSFCNEESGELYLKIIVERMPVTIHQVNKMLDLLIDGEEGSWVFSTDEMVFKTEDLSGKHTIA